MENNASLRQKDLKKSVCGDQHPDQVEHRRRVALLVVGVRRDAERSREVQQDIDERAGIKDAEIDERVGREDGEHAVPSRDFNDQFFWLHKSEL